MEDANIRESFAAFNPELTSDLAFMNRLKRNMEAVELVRQHAAAARRRNRRAVAIAAVAGLVMGTMMGLCLPIVERWIAIPYFDFDIVLWGIAALISSLTAINAYEIARAKAPTA